MKQFTVCYQDDEFSKVEYKVILAKTKADAYHEFCNTYGWNKYAAWVDHYTTQNGSVHYFDTFAGMPY